jgi:hypothetical protein
MSLSANSISDISALYGLEHLEHLDLSNNNIEELDPLVFGSFSISMNVSTYELVSLNVSSNRLASLDAASVRWLEYTAIVTDLSGNPWKCECSALGEAWRELRHKLTLNCASPEDRRGRTWDVIEEDLCPSRHSFANLSSTDNPNLKTSNMIRNSPTETEGAEEFPESDNTTTNSLFINDRNGSSSLMTTIRPVELPASDKPNVSSDATPNINTDGGPALSTSMFVVNGILAACTLVGGGFIAVQLIKKLRKRSEVPEHNEVSVALTETGSLVRVSSSLSLRSTYSMGHVYETIE